MMFYNRNLKIIGSHLIKSVGHTQSGENKISKITYITAMLSTHFADYTNLLIRCSIFSHASRLVQKKLQIKIIIYLLHNSAVALWINSWRFQSVRILWISYNMHHWFLILQVGLNVTRWSLKVSCYKLPWLNLVKFWSTSSGSFSTWVSMICFSLPHNSDHGPKNFSRWTIFLLHGCCCSPIDKTVDNTAAKQYCINNCRSWIRGMSLLGKWRDGSKRSSIRESLTQLIGLWITINMIRSSIVKSSSNYGKEDIWKCC